MAFTSRDRDNYIWSRNCASDNGGGSHGGWWYRMCSVVRLHNNYNHEHTILLNGKWHALPFMEIKIRPLNRNNH